jgi:hypothetical protein
MNVCVKFHVLYVLYSVCNLANWGSEGTFCRAVDQHADRLNKK